MYINNFKISKSKLEIKTFIGRKLNYINGIYRRQIEIDRYLKEFKNFRFFRAVQLTHKSFARIFVDNADSKRPLMQVDANVTHGNLQMMGSWVCRNWYAHLSAIAALLVSTFFLFVERGVFYDGNPGCSYLVIEG